MDTPHENAPDPVETMAFGALIVLGVVSCGHWLAASLAAIVGFSELARSGSIVSNQTFKPLMVYAIVSALYFAICWPLSIYGSRLERRLAMAAR